MIFPTEILQIFNKFDLFLIYFHTQQKLLFGNSTLHNVSHHFYIFKYFTANQKGLIKIMIQRISGILTLLFSFPNWGIIVLQCSHLHQILYPVFFGCRCFGVTWIFLKRLLQIKFYIANFWYPSRSFWPKYYSWNVSCKSWFKNKLFLIHKIFPSNYFIQLYWDKIDI